MKFVDDINKKYLKEDIPEFKVGDSLKVNVKIVEGNRERLQAFEGIVIAKKGKGSGTTITLRKISFGEGVEKTFFLHSPLIEGIKVTRKGRVRRAKLYYLRDRVGKASRVKERTVRK